MEAAATENSSSLFQEVDRPRQEESDEVSVEELYAQIGRLGGYEPFDDEPPSSATPKKSN
jgi:hypothetical protein